MTCESNKNHKDAVRRALTYVTPVADKDDGYVDDQLNIDNSAVALICSFRTPTVKCLKRDKNETNII